MKELIIVGIVIAIVVYVLSNRLDMTIVEKYKSKGKFVGYNDINSSIFYIKFEGMPQVVLCKDGFLDSWAKHHKFKNEIYFACKEIKHKYEEDNLLN